MKKFIKQISQIKSIQSIEINNKISTSKSHIKIVVIKDNLRDMDVEFIYELLYGQDYFEWTFEILTE